MNTAAEPRPSGITAQGPWLEMYARMATIRLFEEQVNDLYRSASYRLGHALMEPARRLRGRDRA